jgi:hypothetical protein
MEDSLLKSLHILFTVTTDNSPFLGTWLNWKVIVMGIILIAGIGLRLPSTNFGVPLLNIIQNGSTRAEESELRRSLYTAYPFVFVIWSGVLVNIVLAVAKP